MEHEEDGGNAGDGVEMGESSTARRLSLDSSGEYGALNGGVSLRESQEITTPSTSITDLPEELVENIFSRLSPYNELEEVKLVCKHWNKIAKKVLKNMKSNFEQSIIEGKVVCETYSPNVNDQGQVTPAGSWILERFGHVACYRDGNIYVVGGTTHTPTTFNDMWRFDLRDLKWHRCLTKGQYPTPKALSSAVMYKEFLVLYGGWSHPSPYPLMQPWRIFDELHSYNFKTNTWTHIITTASPLPAAGHSASVIGDNMIIFGGRVCDQERHSYPLSNTVWLFNFTTQEWYPVQVAGKVPQPRYGQTQISINDSSVLIIGGCGGPNQIFSDVWLLTITEDPVRRIYSGTWEQINTARSRDSFSPTDFQYAGTKVGNSVVFLERSSPISPFLAFLHFDALNTVEHGHHMVFEPARSTYFHSKCSSGLRTIQLASSMSIYTLNISKVLSEKSAMWVKEKNELGLKRPNERLLYTMVQGRADILLFGGFYKEPNGVRCRVSNDVFILKGLHKSY